MSLPVLLQSVRRAPSMWVMGGGYEAVIAFVSGYDAALMGGLLVGLREWLIVKLQDGNNLAWFGLVRELMRRDASVPMDLKTPEDQKAAIEFMFATLTNFLDERDRHDGLRRIHMAYDDWLRQQGWYDNSSPAGSLWGKARGNH